jgi:aspartate ammonia-lyase
MNVSPNSLILSENKKAMEHAANPEEYRVEQDSIGSKDIPENVYYGVQSLRAAENFHITGLAMHPEFINSMAYIKKAAAITNCEIGILDKAKAKAMVLACDEILAGKFHRDFIVDPIQGGAGTSLNMNANEVIANRAIEILGGKKGDYHIVHPNDDVNCGQSTNDVIPTAGKMTSLRLLSNLKKELLRLHKALEKKAEEFDHIIKMGRTQMQDAVPIRLGQEFKAYSAAIMRDICRMDKSMDEMRSLNMGGTAVGTGINADEAYLKRIVPNLSNVSDMEFIQAFDLIDATQNLDSFVSVSGSVKACAVTLSKIANDLRLMSSGPRAGFGEINLPARQNGSSIMPGKINPVIPEVVNQVAFYVIGNDVTITMAAEGGQLELNAFEPIIFYCIFQSIDTLAYAVQTFVDNCVTGITANETRCRYLVENSVGIITAICPHVGYQKAADIAKRAIKTGESVRSLILQENLLTEQELNEILDPVHMTEPGISGKELLHKVK